MEGNKTVAEHRLTFKFQPDNEVLAVTDVLRNIVVREFRCASHQEALYLASVARDMFDMGFARCVAEVQQANDILKDYNITGLQTPKK